MSDWIQWQIHYFGDYLAEARFARYLIAESKPGDQFIDIGANVGYYSLLMSRLVGSEGRVYSYEPVEATYNRLLENMELNDVTNVIATQMAIGSFTGQLNIEMVDENNIGGARVVRDPKDVEVNAVNSSTLDNLLSGEDRSSLRFLKIDVEGYELEVLRGSIATLKEFKPICLVEIRRDQLETFGFTPEDLFEFMTELGYRPHHITDKGAIEPAGPERNANLVAFIP